MDSSMTLYCCAYAVVEWCFDAVRSTAWLWGLSEIRRARQGKLKQIS